MKVQSLKLAAAGDTPNRLHFVVPGRIDLIVHIDRGTYMIWKYGETITYLVSPAAIADIQVPVFFRHGSELRILIVQQ